MQTNRHDCAPPSTLLICRHEVDPYRMCSWASFQPICKPQHVRCGIAHMCSINYTDQQCTTTYRDVYRAIRFLRMGTWMLKDPDSNRACKVATCRIQAGKGTRMQMAMSSRAAGTPWRKRPG